MAYGELKVDSITFTDGGSDVTVSVSGLVKNPTFSGDIVVSGNISGTSITGDSAGFGSVTGVTVTGTTANFVSGVFTSQVSGTAITGNTAGFTTVTGTTVTGTTANFVTVSGTTVTGDAAQFTTLTGDTAGFTTVTGTTVTGTTANFVTVSGTTVTGDAGNFTTATVTSGVFASGTAAAPSVSVGTTDNGIYSPGTDQVAISTSGTGRLFVDANGNVGVGGTATSDASTKTLQVTDSTTARMLLESTGAGGRKYGWYTSVDGQFAVYDYTASSERLRITSTGEFEFTGAGSAGTTQAVYFSGSAPVNSLVIDSTGKVGLGSSSPVATNHIRGSGTSGQVTASWILENASSGTAGMDITGAAGSSIWRFLYGGGPSTGTNTLTPALTIGVEGAAAGNVGVGTTNFGGKLTVKTSSSNGAPTAWGDGQFVVTAGDGTTAPGFGISTNTSDNSISLSALTPGTGWNTIHYRAASHIFYKSDAASNEVGRWDSSGRLLVGTSSAVEVGGAQHLVQVESTSAVPHGGSFIRHGGTSLGAGAVISLARSRGTAAGDVTAVADGDTLGYLIFSGSNGTDFSNNAAWIKAEVDGSPFTSGDTTDLPGRLVFSTTADGASSPTERMRIDSGGTVTLTQPTSGLTALSIYDSANPNFVIYPNGDVFCGPYAPSVPANVAYKLLSDGSATFNGAVSKASGSFRIDHPLKPETHQLVHSFVEGPKADNIYRGKVDLVAGTATVNIDIVAGMTEGTFVALNREVQCFTSNETGWTAVKGSVTGNVLTITAQDNTCSDTISWLVIGERQDKHMYETDWTDENGKVIVEPLKQSEETRSEIPEES